MEAAFFDLDKTIIARSGPLALGRSFFREGLITRSLLLKAAYAQLVFHLMGADEAKMERLRLQASRLTEGWERERVRVIVTEVLDEVISPLIYAEALELIHDHDAAGRLVCIVSSSPEEIVEPLATMLRINTYIASRPRIVDGKYTGDLDFYCYGAAKPQAMKELAANKGIDLDGSFAYSDSITDLLMLEAVGNPVAVNPDRELRKVAVERDWRIETFKNPVSLRRRLPAVRRPTVSLNPVAAAGGVVGVTLAAWWLTRRRPSQQTRGVAPSAGRRPRARALEGRRSPGRVWVWPRGER